MTPEQKRQAIKDSYESLVMREFSYYNGIRTKYTKTKNGYSLWAVHHLFGRYTFSTGKRCKRCCKLDSAKYFSSEEGRSC